MTGNPWSGEGDWALDCELEAVEIPDRAGRTFIVGRVPKIERRFASPMHTVAGMAPRLGDWRDEVQAVLAGVLPTGRLTEPTGAASEVDAVRQTVVSCLYQGLAAGLTVYADGAAGRVAIPDRIDATIDLDALAHDYRGWLTAVDDAHPVVEVGAFEQIDWAVEQMRTGRPHYSDYLWDLSFDKRPSSVTDTIISGVVWGNDPAMTCAFLLKNLTGDGRLWEHVS
jgi:hypothetical protein